MRFEIEVLCWLERLVKNIGCLSFNIRNQQKHIPLNIIDNCELAVRRRIKSEQTQLANPPIDAAAFYDSLNNDAIHQPLQLIAV